MPHVIDRRECAVCGACEAECPHGAIRIHESNRYYIVDPDLCADCGDCTEVCPTEAIAPEAPAVATETAC